MVLSIAPMFSIIHLHSPIGLRRFFSADYRVGQKLMAIILSNLNRFSQLFFTRRFHGKFAVTSLFKITPYVAYVATLSTRLRSYILNVWCQSIKISFKSVNI